MVGGGERGSNPWRGVRDLRVAFRFQVLLLLMIHRECLVSVEEMNEDERDEEWSSVDEGMDRDNKGTLRFLYLL
jgi:hypothetical protein